MSFESALALAYFKRNNATLQQWIVEPAPRAQANAPLQVTLAVVCMDPAGGACAAAVCWL
jgi:hypothetical protein